MITVIDLPQAKRRPLLERLVFRGIVFNMSWEDPEMDRRAFRLTGEDAVLSITSAGCNPLNFLCQSPKRLICVDGNPAQNAILELKLAGLATMDHATFFDIFAARNPGQVETLYPSRLRPLISPRSRKFWDKNLRVVAQGLYRHGRMGIFCRILRRYLKLVKINDAVIEQLFSCDTLEEQQSVYEGLIAPRLWRRSSRMFVSFKPLMYLAGVHPKQFELVDGRHNMYDYIRERIEHALTKVPVKDNYFLSQAISGRFRGYHVPPYLLEENFETLRNNLDRVEIVNGWLEPYLNSLPAGTVNKFNLLDIFDWMPARAMESTLHAVLRAAAPNATLIYRSGSYRLDPPDSVRQHLHHHQELSRELLAIDRSATYGSFYVLSVKNGVAAA